MIILVSITNKYEGKKLKWKEQSQFIWMQISKVMNSCNKNYFWIYLNSTQLLKYILKVMKNRIVLHCTEYVLKYVTMIILKMMLKFLSQIRLHYYCACMIQKLYIIRWDILSDAKNLCSVTLDLTRKVHLLCENQFVYGEIFVCRNGYRFCWKNTVFLMKYTANIKILFCYFLLILIYTLTIISI